MTASFHALLDTMTPGEIRSRVDPALIVTSLTWLLAEALHEHAPGPSFVLCASVEEIANGVRVPRIVLRTLGITSRDYRSCRHVEDLTEVV